MILISYYKRSRKMIKFYYFKHHPIFKQEHKYIFELFKIKVVFVTYYKPVFCIDQYFVMKSMIFFFFYNFSCAFSKTVVTFLILLGFQFDWKSTLNRSVSSKAHINMKINLTSKYIKFFS